MSGLRASEPDGTGGLAAADRASPEAAISAAGGVGGRETLTGAAMTRAHGCAPATMREHQ